MADQSAHPAPLPNPEDPEATALRVKAGLAYVCGHMQELREDLRDAQADHAMGDPPLLRDLREALATGQQWSPVLGAIHDALLAAGDVLGLYGRVHPNARGLVPDGFDTAEPPRSHEMVHLCPINQCSRYSWPQPGSRPHCEITGQLLRQDHL